MSIINATGTTFAIASAYGTAKNMTAITNAVEAVATLEASHGIAVNDYVELFSGWGRANGRIVRAKAVVTNDVTLEGLNTTNLTVYPTGSGGGTVRKVTTWTNLSQVTRQIDSSGGDQNYEDISTIDDLDDRQIPTTRSAVTLTLNFYDDPGLAWYPVVQNATELSVPTALRITFPGGSKILGNCNWSLGQIPTIEGGTLRGKMDLTFAARPMRYAA
jgi:hypothetical protein